MPREHLLTHVRARVKKYQERGFQISGTEILDTPLEAILRCNPL